MRIWQTRGPCSMARPSHNPFCADRPLITSESRDDAGRRRRSCRSAGRRLTLASDPTSHRGTTGRLRVRFAQHDQEHARRLGCVHGVRDVRRHQDHRLRHGAHLTAPDRERERSGQREDQRVKRRRVLRQLFPRVEGEQRDVARRRPGQNAARDALRSWRDESVQREEFTGWKRARHCVRCSGLAVLIRRRQDAGAWHWSSLTRSFASMSSTAARIQPDRSTHIARWTLGLAAAFFSRLWSAMPYTRGERLPSIRPTSAVLTATRVGVTRVRLRASCGHRRTTPCSRLPRGSGALRRACSISGAVQVAMRCRWRALGGT